LIVKAFLSHEASNTTSDTNINIFFISFIFDKDSNKRAKKIKLALIFSQRVPSILSDTVLMCCNNLLYRIL